MDVFGSPFCDFMRGSIYIQCLWLSDGKGRNNTTAMKFSIYWAKDNRHVVYSLGNMLEGTNKDREEETICNYVFNLYTIRDITFRADIWKVTIHISITK